MKLFFKAMVLSLIAATLVVVWYSLPRNVRHVSADFPLSSLKLESSLVQFTTAFTSEALLWEPIPLNGPPESVSLPLPASFSAETFTAYGQGFSPGQNVTLAFLDQNMNSVTGACTGNRQVFQISSTVVDPLDGDLHMHGDFGPSGWSGVGNSGPVCRFVEVVPKTAGPAINITLSGYASSSNQNQNQNQN